MIKEQNNVKIFVYGTLKVGGCYSKQLDKYRHSSKLATLRGTLFNAGYFPALIEKGNDVVYGEIHEYKEPEIVLSIVDHIEGFIGEESKINLYVRKEVKVQLKNNDECMAYVYFFAHNVDKMKQIKNGKWEI